MISINEERHSDSPFVEKITDGQTLHKGSTIRPAEMHWHMVIARYNGKDHMIVVGPLSSSGVASWGPDAEILWIKFKLGAFMPHFPPRMALDVETLLPDASSRAFWLKGSAWEYPDAENVDVFIERLIHEELLVTDPLIKDVLQGYPQSLSPRTVRHRVLQATGLTRSRIFQMERAQKAADLLHQGTSILDTVTELGYFDQPHLTRSLKHWIGYTPAQVMQARASEQIAV
jgi:hypothetical protein